MKSATLSVEFVLNVSRSREGAWIEIFSVPPKSYSAMVAPVRERGLKYCLRHTHATMMLGRSREGAWIEIALLQCRCVRLESLP